MDDLKALPDVLDGRHHVIPIVTGGDEVLEEVNVPEVLPILTLRSSVLFPGAITPITVGREKSIRLVREVNERNGLLGAVLQRESEVEAPAPDDNVDRDDLQTQAGKLFLHSTEYLSLGAAQVIPNRTILKQELAARDSGGFFICTIQIQSTDLGSVDF